MASPAIGDGLNITDKRGMKQGYWKIMGYMINSAQYSPNSLVEEGSYTDNKKEGLWKCYWPNGEAKYEINYNKNRPNGEYVIYYDNGQIEESGTWDINKNVGEFKRYFSNGNAQQEFFFDPSGKRNGIQRYYHDNGQVAMEVNIVNGKENGVLRRYWEDGTMKTEMVLEEGILDKQSVRKFESKDKTLAEFKKIEQAEPETAKSETEVADLPNKAEKFKTDGYNVLYNQNQQITQIGEFRNSRLWKGKWHRYNNDGILVRIEIFRDGQYIGTGVIEEE
jgi:antitoxin component YwqK of YwqJK toxin-antitoxin module